MKFPKAINKDVVNVIIETPFKSRNKFKYEEQTGLFKLHKILPSGFAFPCDMGFIPNTKGQDGDPLDALVFGPEATYPGCLVECRLIGVIEGIQSEKNKKQLRNDRFILVPLQMDESDNVKSLNDINKHEIGSIVKFFQNYNEQEGKKFKLLDISNARTAMRLIKKQRV